MEALLAGEDWVIRARVIKSDAADGADGNRLNVAKHVVGELIVGTEDNMGEDHVKDDVRIPVDVKSSHVLVSE